MNARESLPSRIHHVTPRVARDDAPGGEPADGEANDVLRTGSRRRALIAWLRPRLGSPRAHRLVLVVALLLASPTLWLSLDSDDYLQLVSLDPTLDIEGLERAPWDLYAYARDRASNLALREEGVWPWWTDPDAVMSFFRPLASLSRWVDHTAWPRSVWLMQLQSLSWFALLLWGASRLYRRLSTPSWVAGLAFALFAFDEARAATIGWLCNRNALIAVAFGTWALVAHDRWRADGDRRAGIAAPLCLSLALLGGEGALAAFGYLGAYALFLERGSIKQRALSLLPYFAVLIAWAVVYVTLGYGAVRSGFYVDPIREPLVFLRLLPERLLIYAMAMFEGVSADWFNLAPLFGWSPRPVLLPLAVVLAVLLVSALWPLVRRDPLARFWAFGALVSALPTCGASPSDRLLTAPALGGMALLAMLLSELVDGTYPSQRRWVRVYAGALAVVNLVCAPMLLPLFIGMVDDFDATLARADASVPRDGVRDQTLVFINPPFDTFALFFPVYREVHGIERPKRFRWISTGVFDLRVERVDAHTLKVAPEPGFWANSSQLMLRSLRYPMQRGERVALEGVTYDVVSLTTDGRPAEVSVRFDLPLDSPELRLMKWGVYGYVTFDLPAVGQSVVLPRVDVQAALQGPKPD